MDIPRIRVFKKLISCDSEIRREYTGDKAKRCYSQMWIDKHAEQYFALSGAPDNDNVGKYYRIAENILNSSYNHCIFKQAPFTEKMRYYLRGLAEALALSNSTLKINVELAGICC